MLDKQVQSTLLSPIAKRQSSLDRCTMHRPEEKSAPFTSLHLVQPISANGREALEMEKEFKLGLMVQHMTENGKIIKLTVLEHSITLMVMSIRVSGDGTKQMDLESISIIMGHFIRAIGKMTCRVDLA